MQYKNKSTKKYVYLFELDSVRKTDEEILAGQKALYNEIVVNGNTVVMTYNQLVDSRGFFSLLSDKEYFDNMLSLFKKGAICISQFGEIRTISQYLIESVDTDKNFIYSALPLKGTQKRLLALVKRSLMYSDLSEIYGYTSMAKIKRSEEELEALFVECVKDKKEKNTDLDLKQMYEIIDKLYWLLSIVLQLSVVHEMYISPRDKKEYATLKLYNILERAIQMEPSNLNQEMDLWNNAVQIIKELPAFQEKRNDRSSYLQDLFVLNEKRLGANKRWYQYAEAILNNCHNYACENSICNISKHYNVEELLNTNAELVTFKADFFSRLEQDWIQGKAADQRYLQKNSNCFEVYKKNKDFPAFAAAAHIWSYTGTKDDFLSDKVMRYEYELERQKKLHKRKVQFKVFYKLAYVFLWMIIAVFMNDFFGFLEEFVFEEKFSISFLKSFDLKEFFFDYIFNYSFLVAFVSLLGVEWLSAMIAKKIPGFISLSDAMESAVLLLNDFSKVFFLKVKTYYNTCTQNINVAEKRSKGIMMGCIVPKRIKRYIKYNKRTECFQENESYPFADLTKENVVKELVEMEEKKGIRFGEVYKSDYHVMVVDPIVAEDGNIYPYERVLAPEVDNKVDVRFGKGIVMIPKCGDRFLLMEQDRHAIRERQLAFPRGYSESKDLYQDMKRELQEELGMDEDSANMFFEFMGVITPDSGVQGNFVSVYCVEVTEYEKQIGHEGICDVKAVSKAELEQMISQGEITDGFTLGAYALLKTKMG